MRIRRPTYRRQWIGNDQVEMLVHRIPIRVETAGDQAKVDFARLMIADLAAKELIGLPDKPRVILKKEIPYVGAA